MDKKLTAALFTISMVFLCAALGTLAFVPESELVTGFRDFFGVFLMSANTVTISVATAILIILSVGIVAGAWYGLTFSADRYYAVQTTRAGSIKAHNEAALSRVRVDIAPVGSQVLLTKPADSDLVTDLAHLSPGRINGVQNRYEAGEISRWEAYQLLHSTASRGSAAQRETPALAAPGQQQVDLLATLDTTQRCLVVGASNAGKTTLLQHIVSRRQLSSKVIVIDPHAYPSKWPDCEVIGIQRDYARIEMALQALVKLMTKRYGEIGRGTVAEGGHDRLTILIDEWRAITANLGKSAGDAIKTLLTESRKAAFSVFVATHSDRAKPLGLEGEYDLKDGFTVVYLTIANGQRQAYIDTGDGRMPATLPGPYYGNVGNHPLIEGNWIDLDVKPTDEERRIIEMVNNGDSLRVVSQAVYGQVGQFYNDKIQSILDKFGEK